MKPILDPCCGSKMFYFDKDNALVLFCDNRDEEKALCDGRRLEVHPDKVIDFRDMPFEDESFPLVIFDPPHLRKAGEDSYMKSKYGILPSEGWKEYLRDGFKECWRVLRQQGTLVFKWNEDQIKLHRIQDIFPAPPIMGTRNRYKTIFLVFFKP